MNILEQLMTYFGNQSQQPLSGAAITPSSVPGVYQNNLPMNYSPKPITPQEILLRQGVQTTPLSYTQAPLQPQIWGPTPPEGPYRYTAEMPPAGMKYEYNQATGQRRTVPINGVNNNYTQPVGRQPTQGITPTTQLGNRTNLSGQIIGPNNEKVFNPLTIGNPLGQPIKPTPPMTPDVLRTKLQGAL